MRNGRISRSVVVVALAATGLALDGGGPAGATTDLCTAVDQVTLTSGGSNVNASYDGDGSRIAFVSNRDFVGTNGDGNNEIFLYDAATASYTQITATTGSGGVNVPSISAAGTRVAFQSSKNLTGANSDGNNEIFVWDETGPTLTQITSSASTATNAAPKISADGTHVAFSSNADLAGGGNTDLNQEIFLWAATGPTTTQVTATTSGTGANANPSVSSDGTVVAFRSNRDIGGLNPELNPEIFRWTSTGPTTTAVTSTPSGSNDSPSVSADGTRIAYRSTTDPLGTNGDANQEVFLWSASGPTTTQVTVTTGGSSDGQALAGDGTRLVFRSNRDLVSGGNSDNTFEIFSYEVGGGVVTQLTDTPVGGGGNRAPVMAGDGSSVAFESDRDVTGGNADRNFEIFRTSCGLEVGVVADQAAVLVGEDIDYHVTVHNTGPLPLTGVYLEASGAPACSTFVGDLAASTSTVVDCSYTTTLADLGNFANAVVADADQHRPVASAEVVVDVDYPAGAGAIAGAVTEQGTGTPLGGIWVAALRTSDFSLAGTAVTDGEGAFSAALPAGDHFLYLIDPAATHRAGFHGAPTAVTVTVPEGATTVADPVLAPVRGAISGTVTEEGTGDPVDAVVVSIGGPASSLEIGQATGPTGQFVLPDLPEGPHWIGYVDPTGAHGSEFHPDSPNVPDATPVTVTGGATAVADGSLPAQAPVAGGETISGVVTEAGTDAPLPEVLVVALRAADYQPVRSTTTDVDGVYALDLAEDQYRLAFADLTGRHAMEWYDGLPNTGLADSVPVSAPGTANADLDSLRGTLAGTVTGQPSGDPVAGAWVVAIGPGGIVGGDVTGGDGTWAVGELPVGTYRVTVVDVLGGRPQTYWPDSPTYEGADDLVVAGGAVTTADVALAAP